MPDLISALAPRPEPKRSRFDWAEVTQASPLRIRLSSDSNPLDIEPTTNVLGLQVGDVVRVEITAQGQVVVLGRRGGLAAANVPDLPASKVTSGTLDAARRWTGAPLAMDAGRAAVPSGGGNEGGLYWSPSFTITFAVGRFSSAPQVVASPDPGSTGGVGVGADVLAVSASSCTVRVNRWTLAPGPNFYVRWIAVEV